jgi:phosphatidylglycerol:prolipoprotein diacylglycerol transferase
VNAYYALGMVAAVATGALVAARTGTRLPISPWQRFGLGLGAFVGAMIGAKLPFALATWDELISGAAWFSSGKTILTGIVGGYFGVEIAKWCLDLKTRTGDSFVLPVAAAVAIGRLACFVGGCCYGAPTQLPWGVVFPRVDALPRHPTQLYESLFHAVMLLFFFRIQRTEFLRGQRIKAYILLYAVYRFFSEFLRPEPRIAGGLTIYQFASLSIIVLFVTLWMVDRPPVPTPPAPSPEASAPSVSQGSTG